MDAEEVGRVSQRSFKHAEQSFLDVETTNLEKPLLGFVNMIVRAHIRPADNHYFKLAPYKFKRSGERARARANCGTEAGAGGGGQAHSPRMDLLYLRR